MADTSVDVLKKTIQGILKGADLDSLSAKKVRKMLEEKFSADFSERKKEIDKLVMKLIEEMEEEEPESEAEEESQNGKESSEDEGVEDEVPKKKQKTSSAPSAKEKAADKKRKSAKKADDSEDPVMAGIKEMDDEDLAKKLQEEESGLRRRATRGAAPKPRQRKEKEKDPDKKKKPSLYSRPCNLSEELGAVVGATEMPRPEVVKTLWSIVKERNLQDPENRQFMLCDAQMEALFGLKRVRLFSMMKYLKKHIKDIPR